MSAARRATITVVHGGQSAIVRPARLFVHDLPVGPSVRLLDIWTAAQLPGHLGELEFDFVGHDGFRPSRLGLGYLPGERLPGGFLHLETGDVRWPESSDVVCAYRVKALAMLVAHGA